MSAGASQPTSFGAVRWGARSTGVPIEAGIPHSNPAAMPAPIATAGLTSLYGGLALDNMGGLALDNMGGLALDNMGGIGDFLKDDSGSWSLPKIGVGALVAFGLFKFYKSR
jgi:hypothetical protein